PDATGAPSWRIAGGARVDVATGGASSGAGLAVGAELRGAVGWHHLGVVATAGILAPSEDKLGSFTVRQQRFPTSVAARLRWPLPRGFDATGAIGLALVPL